MRNKRITRTVSVVMLLALLISLIPLTGMTGTATAETTERTETVAAETPEPTMETTHETAAPAEEPPASETERPDPAEPEPKPDPVTLQDTVPSAIGPDEPDAEGWYTNKDGIKYIFFADPYRKSTVYVYKSYFSGIYFYGGSGIGKRGSFPWLSTETLTMSGDSSYFYTTGDWVYCIDYKHSAATGSAEVYPDLNSSPSWSSLSAAKKLGITLALSYGAQRGSHNNNYAYVATQTIIWEYQVGSRNSSSGSHNHGIYYSGDNNGNYTFSLYKEKIDAEYDRILGEIAKAEKVPNMAETSYEFTGVGASYAHQFTDNNNALSQGVWQVSSCPSELSATISNGKLVVYPTASFSGEKTITLKRNLWAPSGASCYICEAGNQEAIIGVPTDSAEVKIKVTLLQTNNVHLKKTAAGSESVLACIQDNPLYTLQGAVYEIHQGSATGPVVETLITDANGEAAGTKQYPVGTKLYAVETVAPSGYLLNSSPAELTVTTGSNIFNVTDTPTFDPNQLAIKKTGTTNTRVNGAVFKAEFYASNWVSSGSLQRTWYLQSDANGYVYFDDNHLATGYESDPLFKPYQAPRFPLGLVVITEIKAADGYLLPAGNTGKVYIFIKQGEAGQSASAYWGDGTGAPISSGNPTGIYKMENDANPAALTAVNNEVYGAAFSLVKTDPYGAPLGGAVFQVDYFNATWFDETKLERTWYFVTDENGYFSLSETYLSDVDSSNALFPTNAIPLGIMRVREARAPEGYQVTDFMGIWRMRQLSSGSSKVLCYWAADDGYTPTTSYGDMVYVDASDPSALTVINTRLPYATMKKLVSEGSAAGFRFRLRNETASKTYYGESDADGNVFLTDKHYLPQLENGEKVYEFTDLTPGTYRFVEARKQGYVPAYFKFSVAAPSGEVTQLAYFDTAAILTASEAYDGTDYYSPSFQIESLPAGSILRVEIKNTLQPGTAQMEKLSDTGDVAGFYFKLYRHSDALHGAQSWYGISDENGAIYLTDSSWTQHTAEERTYTFEGLYDGQYSFKEVLSECGRDDVWPESIEFITSGGTTSPCHVVFPDAENGYELVSDGGDCRISGVYLTGLNGGGTLAVKITNKTETPPEPVNGSLTIVKVDRGTREPLEGAGFRLFDAEGTQIAEEYTDQDGFVEFVGLEIGDYTYQEFEAPEGFALDDTLYPFSVTEDNLDIEIEMENDITEGSIRVHKINEQGQSMKDVYFLLEYSLDDGESWLPIGYRDDNEPVQIGCSTNDDAVDGVAPTSAPDGWIAFEGLAVNTQLGSILYRLTEVKTWDGYELLAEPVFEGCLTAEQTEIELVAVNHPSFEMPMTGSDGFAGAGIGLGLCLLASVLLLLFLPKKREDMNNG